MADLTTYFGAKLAAMVGGFFGSAAILTFIRPKTIGEAFIRGGVSVGSAIIFSTPLLDFMGLKTNWEYQMMSGFIIGFVSYSFLGMVANFLLKHQNKDIVETIRIIKDTDKKD
jgi:hypothetical protein